MGTVTGLSVAGVWTKSQVPQEAVSWELSAVIVTDHCPRVQQPTVPCKGKGCRDLGRLLL